MSNLVIRRKLIKIIAAASAAIVMVNPVLSKKLNKNKHHRIAIKDFKYLPTRLKVSVGDTITWTNYDIVPHTVTANDHSWDSQLIQQGQEWSLTISAAAQTSYYCRYHPTMKAEFKTS